MTKDEELKDAREWLSARYGFSDIPEDNPAVETLIAYHYHRLESLPPHKIIVTVNFPCELELKYPLEPPKETK